MMHGFGDWVKPEAVDDIETILAQQMRALISRAYKAAEGLDNDDDVLGMKDFLHLYRRKPVALKRLLNFLTPRNELKSVAKTAGSTSWLLLAGVKRYLVSTGIGEGIIAPADEDDERRKALLANAGETSTTEMEVTEGNAAPVKRKRVNGMDMELLPVLDERKLQRLRRLDEFSQTLSMPQYIEFGRARAVHLSQSNATREVFTKWLALNLSSGIKVDDKAMLVLYHLAYETVGIVMDFAAEARSEQIQTKIAVVRPLPQADQWMKDRRFSSPTVARLIMRWKRKQQLVKMLKNRAEDDERQELQRRKIAWRRLHHDPSQGLGTQPENRLGAELLNNQMVWSPGQQPTIQFPSNQVKLYRMRARQDLLPANESKRTVLTTEQPSHQTVDPEPHERSHPVRLNHSGYEGIPPLKYQGAPRLPTTTTGRSKVQANVQSRMEAIRLMRQQRSQLSGSVDSPDSLDESKPQLMASQNLVKLPGDQQLMMRIEVKHEPGQSSTNQNPLETKFKIPKNHRERMQLIHNMRAGAAKQRFKSQMNQLKLEVKSNPHLRLAGLEQTTRLQMRKREEEKYFRARMGELSRMRENRVTRQWPETELGRWMKVQLEKREESEMNQLFDMGLDSPEEVDPREYRRFRSKAHFQGMDQRKGQQKPQTKPATSQFQVYEEPLDEIPEEPVVSLVPPVGGEPFSKTEVHEAFRRATSVFLLSESVLPSRRSVLDVVIALDC